MQGLRALFKAVSVIHSRLSTRRIVQAGTVLAELQAARSNKGKKKGKGCTPVVPFGLRRAGRRSAASRLVRAAAAHSQRSRETFSEHFVGCFGFPARVLNSAAVMLAANMASDWRALGGHVKTLRRLFPVTHESFVVTELHPLMLARDAGSKRPNLTKGPPSYAEPSPSRWPRLSQH